MLPIVIINLVLRSKMEQEGKNLLKRDLGNALEATAVKPGAVTAVLGAAVGMPGVAAILGAAVIMPGVTTAILGAAMVKSKAAAAIGGIKEACRDVISGPELIQDTQHNYCHNIEIVKGLSTAYQDLIPYQNVKFKMLFLPRKRGIDLKKFVEDYREDVHYCSGEVLYIYCDPDELSENAHKTLIPLLGMKSAVELPALALWESNPKESVYLPLYGLSEEEIYRTIEHLCNTIKEEPGISLASLGHRAGQYMEEIEGKKRPLLIQQNEVHIAANNGSVYTVAGDNNRLEQTSSAVGFLPEQWQQFIDVLRENGVQQREQGERVMELLGQIKLAAEANDEAVVQEKADQVRKLLKTIGSNVLQGINLTGALATIASVLGLA